MVKSTHLIEKNCPARKGLYFKEGKAGAAEVFLFLRSVLTVCQCLQRPHYVPPSPFCKQALKAISSPL